MEIEKIKFSSDGDTFKGKVYRPDDLNKCKGIVIFTHGLGYCDRQYKINGEKFVENNYLLMTYNLRGHAGSPGQWSLEASARDLSAAIDALIKNYKFENNDRICVMGHSTGALISLLTSLKDPRIKFASIITIVTSLTDSYLHWFNSGFNYEVQEYFKTKGVIPSFVKKFLNDKTMLEQFKNGLIPDHELDIEHRYGLLKSPSLRKFFHEVAYSPNIINTAKNLNIPILLFRGQYDEVMDVWKTNELYETLGGRLPSKLYVTGSRNHFHNDRWDMIQSETLKFFDEFCSYSENKVNPKMKDILIVDDESLVTRTLKSLLRKNEFDNVVIADNGLDALEKIKEIRKAKNKHFDLIIADIRMPGIDGVETIRRARQLISDQHGKQSPVIFITGYEGARKEDANDVGYVDYLYKPLDLEHFLESVRKQLT